MKKNVLLFRGIDAYSLEEAVMRWTGIFTSKYGEHNISLIDASDPLTPWKSLESEIMSGGIFAEKRLFLLRNFIIRPRKQEDTENPEEESIQTKEASLISMIETIPDDNFLIIVNPEIPKTKKIYKFLEAQATIKDFDAPYAIDAWKRRFPDLEENVIQKLLRLYKDNENIKDPKPISFDIYSSLEHLYLYTKSSKNYHVADFINGDKEVIIFSFLDELYAGNRKKAREMLHRILGHAEIYPIIGGIIGNIRNALYVKALSHYLSPGEIEKTLKLNPFVIKNALHTRVSENALRQFFHHIIEANMAQKSGKWMYEGELGLIFAIELGILSLQN